MAYSPEVDVSSVYMNIGTYMSSETETGFLTVINISTVVAVDTANPVQITLAATEFVVKPL